MTTLDPDMGAAVHQAMEGIGIDVHTDTAVTGFETSSDRRIRSVVTADGSIPADVTVEEITALDLSYAPPFSPVWDPILVAARQAAAAVRQTGAGRSP